MSVVYVIGPALTVGVSSVSDAFLEAFDRSLREFASVSVLSSLSAMRMAEPLAGDIVILFNREDGSYDASILHFLEKAKAADADILPVAAAQNARTPPAIVQDKQSFDVAEHLRQRALDPSQVATVATVFARQVMSTFKPSLCVEPMHLFLCHRRLDGEEVTARFHRSLLAMAQKAFRDLFDIRVGGDAQEIIESSLRESDAVIFLDTAKSGESIWIRKELQTALSLQLPVVWVRIGQESGRAPLSIIPSGSAHFVYPDLNPATDEISATEIEEIIKKAFRIHHRDYVDRLLDEFSKLKEMARQQGIELVTIDPRRMIFSLTLPRKAARYRERPLTHLLQLFGRSPTKQDVSDFSTCAKEIGYEPHPKHGAHYDSVILLAAIPSQASASFDDCGVHKDSIGDYVADFQRTTSPQRKSKRLVVSGAYADCEPEFHQNMTNAVHAVVEASLRAGMGVTFGAHPTFQFMIFDLAKRLRPDDCLSALRMYISRFFVTETLIEEFRKNAEVIPIDAVGSGRVDSLTAMRLAMLNDGENGALVVIGGKTARGGHSPGIDEEIRLALKVGLPVYVFGSVGGRSSEISAAMTPAERLTMNGLSEAANSELGTSLDYARLAKLVVDSSG